MPRTQELHSKWFYSVSVSIRCGTPQMCVQWLQGQMRLRFPTMNVGFREICNIGSRDNGPAALEPSVHPAEVSNQR